MKTVCNATPIISLASVKKLDILKEMFHKIIIPEAVYNEITDFRLCASVRVCGKKNKIGLI